MLLNKIQHLPDEILQNIFSLCPKKEQPQYEVICKRFAELLRNPFCFPELCLFKASIATFKQHSCQLKNIKLLSEKSVAWLSTALNVASRLKNSAILQCAIGIPLNALLKQIPVINVIYYPYELLGLECIWDSSSMAPIYSAITYLSLTTEVACMHLLANNSHDNAQKALLEKALVTQQQFLKSYWEDLQVNDEG